MGKTDVIDKIIEYSNELKKHMDFKRVVLFGSFARGTAEKDSDIDVAVVVEKIQGDFLSVSPLLWKIASKIDSRIEPILLEDGSDESGFLESIDKYGEVITAN